jgi:hypothetical protein
LATSETAICNDALVEIGAGRIASLTEDSATARICNEQYTKIRDEMLAGHPWNFSLKRASLAASGTAPVNKYTKAWVLPTDCLRVLEVVDGEEIDWQKEGNYLVSDTTSMDILYIAKITDVGNYPPHFSRALALKLAASVSYALVQSTSLKEMLEKKAEFTLAQARSFDGQEGAPRKPYANTWLNSRY